VYDAYERLKDFSDIYGIL